MKLIIGNKNYSSWSLRGWLACKQSGLAFEEIKVNVLGEDWEQTKHELGDVQPSSGKVPILWDGDVVIWDSLAILEHLGDVYLEAGRERQALETYRKALRLKPENEAERQRIEEKVRIIEKQGGQ